MPGNQCAADIDALKMRRSEARQSLAEWRAGLRAGVGA